MGAERAGPERPVCRHVSQGWEGKTAAPRSVLNRCEGLSNVLTNERLVVRCAVMEYMTTVELKGQAGNAAGLQGSTDVNIGS